jgi:trigger factor
LVDALDLGSSSSEGVGVQVPPLALGRDMKVKIESPKPWQRVLEVEVPAERVEEEFDSIYENYKKKSTLPGFRKGKAPLSILQARFGRRIEGEVLGKLLPLAYKEATQREKLTPIDQPQLSEVEFKRGAPLRFKATVEVKPEVQLGNYLGLKVTKMVKRITDQEVDEVLNELRREKAILTPVNRRAREGDFLILQLRDEGSVKEEVEGELGQGRLLPQLEAQLVGIAKGEERQIEVDYPETHHDVRYRGRRVRLGVKAMEIKEKRLPRLDREFLEEMGNFHSLKELKERIRADLQVKAEADAQKGLKEEILDLLIKRTSLEVPESMIRSYLDYVVSQARRRHRSVDEERIKLQYRPQAIREITASLILEEIAKREEIVASPQEVEQRVSEVARGYNMGKEEARDYLIKTDQMKGLVRGLREENVFNFLIGNGEITTIWV